MPAKPLIHLLTRTPAWDLIQTPLPATLSPSGKFLRLSIGDGTFELLRLPGPPIELHGEQLERFIAYTDADIAVTSKVSGGHVQEGPALYHFTVNTKRIAGLEELTEEASYVLERAYALRRVSGNVRSACATSIEAVLPLGTRIKEVLSCTTDQGVQVIYAALLPTGEVIHYEDPLYASHARCWMPLPHERAFFEEPPTSMNTGVQTRTLTGRLLALGEEYTTLECTLRFLKHFPNEREERRIIGAYYACATITSWLRPTVLLPETPPAQAQKVVLDLLHRLQEDWQTETLMVRNRPRGLLEIARLSGRGRCGPDRRGNGRSFVPPSTSAAENVRG